MDNTTFQSVLEQLVLAQNPDLFIYAQKLSKGMIQDMDHIYVRVFKDSPLFPEPPFGYKFKNPESYATIIAGVVQHDKITNQVLLADGIWHEAKHYNNRESSWIHDVEPIEEPKPLPPGEDIF